MKGQSIIIEFILFFLISFSVFSMIGYLFYTQNSHFGERIFVEEAKVMNDMVIIDVLKGVECKACTRMVITENIHRKMGEATYQTEVTDSGGVNTTGFGKETFSVASPIFNLNATYDFSGKANSVNKKTQIKINNDIMAVEVV